MNVFKKISNFFSNILFKQEEKVDKEEVEQMSQEIMKIKQYQDLLNKECLIIEDFAGTTIHDRDLLSALYIFLETRVQTHRKSVFEAKQKPNAKVKFRITIITTCRAYEEWIDFFECDKMKAASIATLFYGFGEILYVDVTNKHAIEQDSE